MRTKFKITTEVRNILLDVPEIKELVKDKIYPIMAPKDTIGDFLIYQRDEYSKEYTKMGIHSERCRVYISAISDNYDRSQELAYLINESLEGIHPDLDLNIKLADSTEDYEDGKYIQVLLFDIN